MPLAPCLILVTPKQSEAASRSGTAFQQAPNQSPGTPQDKSPARFLVPPGTPNSRVQEHATLGTERKGSLGLHNTPRWASCGTGEHRCCAHASPNFFCFPGKPAHPGSSQSSAPNLSQRTGPPDAAAQRSIWAHWNPITNLGQCLSSLCPSLSRKANPSCGSLLEKVPIAPWQCQDTEPPSPSLSFRAKVCS